jgi:CHAD domain-containing protein
MSDYFARVRTLIAQNANAETLHGIRLASKRVRYTLELFIPCYGPGLETRIASLRKVQQLLGDMNDAAVASKTLDLPDASPLQAFLAKRVQEKTKEFRAYWEKNFDAPGREAWWTDYLARHARVPAGVPSGPARV